MAGGVALALGGGAGPPTDAECTAKLEAQYEVGKVNADAYPAVRKQGCGPWLDRLAAGEISEESYDGTSADPSAAAAPDSSTYDAYAAEVGAAGESLLFSSVEEFDSEAGTLCHLAIDEMSAWMRLQVESGAWPTAGTKTQLMNYGSLVRHACPAKVAAFTEAARQTIFAGPATGTSTEDMPDALKKAMFDECKAKAAASQDAALLDVCRAYI